MRGPSLALVLVLAACHRTPPGEAPDQVCAKGNDGKAVAITGYLHLPGIMVGCDSGPSCKLYVGNEKRASYDGIAFDIPLGDKKGMMEPLAAKQDPLGLPPPKGLTFDEVKLSDIRIWSSRGLPLKVGAWIRAEGTLAVREEGGKLECRLSTLTRFEPAE